MRQGGYFTGKVSRVVDKFSNAWVKFPNEKKEHWWPVEVLLPWMPAGAAFAAMPAAFAAIATAAAAAAAAKASVVPPAEPTVTAATTEPAALVTLHWRITGNVTGPVTGNMPLTSNYGQLFYYWQITD